jgi:D-tyrosyl-tRNA(Tyr) deacylase
VRALLQRTTGARVRVDDEVVGEIGSGLVILVGVGPEDDEAVADALARRATELRIFDDTEGRTNLSLLDVGGEALVVSQFTLYADTRRGRRPGFTGAAAPAMAERLYLRFAETLRSSGARVATGRFGAVMAVELVNDGPFTIWLDTASP